MYIIFILFGVHAYERGGSHVGGKCVCSYFGRNGDSHFGKKVEIHILEKKGVHQTWGSHESLGYGPMSLSVTSTLTTRDGMTASR